VRQRREFGGRSPYLERVPVAAWQSTVSRHTGEGRLCGASVDWRQPATSSPSRTQRQLPGSGHSLRLSNPPACVRSHHPLHLPATEFDLTFQDCRDPHVCMVKRRDRAGAPWLVLGSRRSNAAFLALAATSRTVFARQA